MSKQGNTKKGQTCNGFDGQSRYTERCGSRWRAACIINMYYYIWRCRTRGLCCGGRHGRNGGAAVYSSMPRRFAHTLLGAPWWSGTGGRMRARERAARYHRIFSLSCPVSNHKQKWRLLCCFVRIWFASAVDDFLTHTLSSLYFVRAKWTYGRREQSSPGYRRFLW